MTKTVILSGGFSQFDYNTTANGRACGLGLLPKGSYALVRKGCPMMFTQVEVTEEVASRLSALKAALLKEGCHRFPSMCWQEEWFWLPIEEAVSVVKAAQVKVSA